MKWNAKVFGFGLMFVLGLILAFAPVPKNGNHKIDTKQLLAELQHHDYFIAPEDLAHMIIDKEPGFIVVDIRSNDDFKKYHIPGSIHIPINELLKNKELKALADENTIILISNGNTLASQAWLLLKQNGFNDVYILRGGLNYWVQIFTRPPKPAGTYTDDELFRYEFRVAAGPVMMGRKIVQSEEKKQTKIAKPVIRVRKKKKATLDEGC